MTNIPGSNQLGAKWGEFHKAESLYYGRSIPDDGGVRLSRDAYGGSNIQLPINTWESYLFPRYILSKTFAVPLASKETETTPYNLPPYHYSPLPEGYIRLLRLMPHQDKYGPIQCQLFDYVTLPRCGLTAIGIGPRGVKSDTLVSGVTRLQVGYNMG